MSDLTYVASKFKNVFLQCKTCTSQKNIVISLHKLLNFMLFWA